MSLGRRAVRGVAATAGGQWARFVIHIGSTMILARLVTPEDYGLVTMIVAITGLIERLLTVGLRTATIQRRELNNAQVSALFWITISLGTLATGVFALSAQFIAGFYGQDELVPVALAMSSVFLLSTAGTQHVALLERELRFSLLAVMEIAAIAVAAVVAVIAAMLGLGYWAIALLHVVQPAVRGCFGWFGTGWVPALPRDRNDLGELLSFGAYQTFFQVLVYLSQNVDNVLIGREVGAASLGVYSRAYALLLMPIRQLQAPLHRVAIPTLSRLQDQPERFRRFYRTGLSATAHTAIPLILVMAVAADDVIWVALGDQWTEAGPIFRVLAFAGLATVIGHANGWLYVSLGRVRRQAVWGLIVHPILIGSFFIGLPGGALGVATAYTIARWVTLPASLAMATHGTPVAFADAIRSVWRPAVVASVAYAGAWAVREGGAGWPVFGSLSATGLAFGVVYMGVLVSWPAARSEFKQLVGLVRGGFRS